MTMTPPCTAPTPSPCIAATDCWSRLHDGPLLVKADERARGAIEYRPETIPPVVDDPSERGASPAAGLSPRTNGVSCLDRGPRRSHTWKRSHTFGVFLHGLHTQLAARITSEGRDDGTVRQSLPTEDAVEAWHAQRTTYFSATATDQLHVTAARRARPCLPSGVCHGADSGWRLDGDV